ncbi:MAG: tetratricopeptide repeat protein [Rhabdochlamydiaceae bacterium]|nr:tetratricopeptide repeat protein [Candidatus Amphrikana amoebophyrae]
MKKWIYLLMFAFCISVAAQEKLTDEQTYGLIKKATQFEDEKQYKEAINIYKELLIDKPINREYLHRIALLYYRDQEYRESEKYYLAILKWYGTDIEASIWLARIYYRQQKFKLAQQYLEPVIEKHPDYIEAAVLLVRIYMALDEWEKAEERLEATVALDPDDVTVINLLGNVYVHNGQYSNAYNEYKKAWIESGGDIAYLDRMIGVRDAARPHARTTVAFSQEREIDLVSQLLTTQINTWFTEFSYNYPLRDNVQVYAKGMYSPEQQFNKISNRNNYYVNNYANTLGFEYKYFNYLTLKMQSHLKWGTNKGKNNIFPFDTQTSWEPLVSLRVGNSHVNYAASIYKESFVGRDFSDLVAMYVRKRSVLNGVNFRFFNGKSIVGGDGTLSIYTGSRQNRLREFNLFAIQRIDTKPIAAIIEYKYLYGNFTKVDKEYFSYRARYRHFGTLRLIRPWGGRNAIEARYTFKWQKLREFVNVAEEISANNARPPQELLLNILTANEFELVGKFSIRDHFTVEGGINYYFDSNQYKTMGGNLKVNYYF